MHKVYILQSLKDGKTYIGYSGDFERRFKKHNSGRVNATKHRQPLEVAPKYYLLKILRMRTKQRSESCIGKAEVEEEN